jgi:chromosome segregation ATPase
MSSRFLFVLLALSFSVDASLAADLNQQSNLAVKSMQAQVASTEKILLKTRKDMVLLKEEISQLDKDYQKQQEKITILTSGLKASEQREQALGLKLEQLDAQNKMLQSSLAHLGQQTDQKTQQINQTISLRTQWYAAAMIFLLLLLVAGYWYLRRRSHASEQGLSERVQQVIETVRASDERLAKADTELADSLFAILNQLKAQDMAVAASAKGNAVEPNHHLPLKLADEIHRMRKRLSSLPAETKGLTPLKKSLERLETELADQGYEIIDHTGMTYTENLSVKARFIPSDELDAEQRLISKVVTPQVNYHGVMIRMADIEVSIGS